MTEQTPAVLPEKTAHDDFDWSLSKRSVAHYTEEERKTLDALYDPTFLPLEEQEVVMGVIEKINKQDVLVSVGYKSDGLIAKNEFRDTPELLKEGNQIEVFIVEKEDRQGSLKLSRRLAVLEKAWAKIKGLYESGEVVVGRITAKTKGGLLANIDGFDTFLPGSQIDVKQITDYDQFVGQSMEFKVVKINDHIRNAVVSHKILIENDMAAQRFEIMNKLEKGQIVEGVVKNITNFGAFLDLGGLDGLLYITDISWGRINHPSDVLCLDKKLNVVVLDFDESKKRISLGLKQLSPHPWDHLPEHIQEGAKVTAKVVNIEDYGGFLEILPGIEGLVHVSEITWNNTPVSSREFFGLGAEHEVMITKIGKEDKKISLSIKRLLPDPWENIEQKYPEGTKHTGVVKTTHPYNVVVDLESGIAGMLNISDLSWTKRFSHTNKFTKPGANLEILILKIDKENRKLQLGHKQLEEDPWLQLQEIFAMGSMHEGTIIRKDEKGATILLPYGIEAFCSLKHLMTQEGKELVLEETAQFLITHFDPSQKRLDVSHTRCWEEGQRVAKENERQERQREKKTVQKTVENIQNRIEKSTLGDIEALSVLKKKMDAEERGQES